jgi:hypothetical protein
MCWEHVLSLSDDDPEVGTLQHNISSIFHAIISVLQVEYIGIKVFTTHFSLKNQPCSCFSDFGHTCINPGVFGFKKLPTCDLYLADLT